MICDLMVNHMEIQDFVELPCISLLRHIFTANSPATQLTQLLTSYDLLFQGVFVFKGKKRKAKAGMLGWNNVYIGCETVISFW